MSRRPVIGITCSWDDENGRFYLSHYYTQAVEAAGGLPVLLSSCSGINEMRQLLNLLDGLLLSGGPDVDPVYFGEEPLPGCGEITPKRDALEIELARLALAVGLPILGICRGVQVLNIAAGGDIYQDLATQVPGCIKHDQQAARWYPTHTIHVEADTRLAALVGPGSLRVNSFHHQAVRTPAPGFIVSARAPDGVIEAIEGTSCSFVLGVQCHPEGMWNKDVRFLNIFRALVEAGLLLEKNKSITI